MSDPAPELGEVGLLPSRTRRVAMAGGAAGALAIATFALVFAVSPAFMPAIPVVVIGGVFAAIAWASRARYAALRGPLTIDAEGVNVAGRRIASRASIRRGYVVPAAREGTLVRLERRWLPPIDLAVDDLAHGQRVLAAAEVDAARAAADFHVLGESRADYAKRFRLTLVSLFSFLLFTLTVTFASGNFWLMVLGIPILVVLSLSLAIPTRLTVGTDGMVVRWLATQRFVSFEGVTDVDVVDGEPFANTVPVLVRLRDAEGNSREEILVDMKQYGPFAEAMHALITARADALAERIREAIAVKGRAGGELDLRTLARGGRDTGAWLAELRGALDTKETFRAAPAPTPEALLRVVEDVTAKPVERAAAAIALAGVGDEARQKIRIVAEATAAPQLRVALEAVASEDEVAEALEALEK